MDRHEEGAARLDVGSENAHDVARLPEVEAIEWLVEHQQRLRREQAHGEHHSTMLAFRELREPGVEERLQTQ